MAQFFVILSQSAVTPVSNAFVSYRQHGCARHLLRGRDAHKAQARVALADGTGAHLLC